MPRYGHKSDPHTHVAASLTMASVGLMIVGFGVFLEAHIVRAVKNGCFHK